MSELGNKLAHKSLTIKKFLVEAVVCRSVSDNSESVTFYKDVIYSPSGVCFVISDFAGSSIDQVFGKMRQSIRNVTRARNGDRKRNALFSAVAENGFRFVYPTEYVSSVSNQFFAVRSKRHSLFISDENRNTEFAFELFYSAAQIRLSDIQLVRGFIHCAAVCDFNGVFQIQNVH